MKEVIKLDTVDQYNQFFGLETLHPLVSVVDLSEATKFPTHFTMNYGIYGRDGHQLCSGTGGGNGDAAGSEAERPRSFVPSRPD